jgi:hypothetical protein
MKPVLRFDKLDLKSGYFYFVQIMSPDPWEEQKPDWIISTLPNDYDAHADVVERKEGRREFRICRLNEAHRWKRHISEIALDLSQGRYKTPFLYTAAGGFVVNKSLKEALTASGLTGFEVQRVNIGMYPRFDTPEDTPEDKNVFGPFFRIFGMGKECLANPQVFPPSADKCPWCGQGPIVCPDCGHCLNPCEKCGRDWGVAEHNPDVGKNARIIIEEKSALLTVIDPRRWDGSDFFMECYLTRRAVDFLLSIHAAPFVAEPVPVNMLGISEKDRLRLEAARKPLPQWKEIKPVGKAPGP